MVDAGQSGPLSLGQRLRAETVFAFWSVVPNQHLVEAVTRCGYGGIVIDAQHGLHDFASIERMVPSIVSCGRARWCACRSAISRLAPARSMSAAPR